MKKLPKLTVLLLVLALMLSACGCKHEIWNPATCDTPKTCAECGEIEGAPLGHQWQDATCEEPKTCSVCGATAGASMGHAWVEATCVTPKICSLCLTKEGEAAGHAWIEATTEKPKTCSVCGLAEGERIITDPRFTTASTKDIQGTWVLSYPVSAAQMGMTGFNGVLGLQLVLELRNDATMELTATSENGDSFMDSLVEYATEENYKAQEADGLSRDEVDAMFEVNFNTTVEDYMRDALSASLNLEDWFASFHTSGVYYVEDGEVYIAETWQSNPSATKFTVTNDTLTLMEDFLGTGASSSTFTRVPKA